MKTLTIVSLLALASTPAFAGNLDPAYAYSGTHAGGPADLLISSTGGPVARMARRYRDPAYAYSGTHAGGPADLLVGATGGRIAPVVRRYRDPAYAYSGTHAGGPADLLNRGGR
jgi:hypothetical protein